MLSDFRSDTLTKPTPAMLDAMFSAPVGDDVFGEDPTVNELEAKAADMFGKEAALFCPSGTMANQIAIKGHSNAPGELICDKLSHVYLYEVGGIAFHSGLSVSLTEASLGILKPADILERINLFADMHKAPSQLVVLENTCNKGGGSCYELQNLQEIKKLCFEKDLKLHLDGARVFNAIVAKGYSSREIGDCFDSISICLSKGLGTPMGSLLIGNKDYIQKCRRIRKLFGGGMRQAGFMAAAGIYALEHHIGRLAEDHQLAKAFGAEIAGLSYIEEVFPVETNIVIAKLAKEIIQTEFLTNLSSNGVKAVPFGPQLIRFVTHLDVNASNVSHALDVLKKIAV
jgi:threonine aldolase